jgi:replicative DNA helicase
VTPDDVPSQDLAAEEALIGACMLSSTALDEAAEIVTERDFYRPAHGELFAAMVTMRDKGEAVDPVTLGHHLADVGTLQRFGGLPRLHDFMAAVPTATNAAYYAEIVRDHALRRGLDAAGVRARQLARTPSDDVAELIEQARMSFDEQADLARGGSEAREIGDLVDLALARYENPAPEALPTGFIDLDARISGGLRPGTFTVIGARPGQGKSIIGGNIATNVARSGKGVLFVELEMTEEELVDRIISNIAGVRLGSITSHKLNQQEWGYIQQAAARLRDLPLLIDDEPHMSVTGIRSRARDRMRTPRGLSLVVVDQLNLVRPATARLKREEEVAELSRNFKLLAKELHVPIVVLHQLNREPEKRGGGKPQLSDLRDSGMVEANADIVILLHPQPEDDPRAGEIDLIFAKNRQGPQGVITMAWQPHYARVGDLAAPAPGY